MSGYSRSWRGLGDLSLWRFSNGGRAASFDHSQAIVGAFRQVWLGPEAAPSPPLAPGNDGAAVSMLCAFAPSQFEVVSARSSL